jgi:hypothetical protein
VLPVDELLVVKVIVEFKSFGSIHAAVLEFKAKLAVGRQSKTVIDCVKEVVPEILDATAVIE